MVETLTESEYGLFCFLKLSEEDTGTHIVSYRCYSLITNTMVLDFIVFGRLG